MLRWLVVVVGVVILPLALTTYVLDGECRTEGQKIKCICTESQSNYSEVFLQGNSESTELTISGCANVELKPGFFIQDHPLEKISFLDIGRLIVVATFPSQLSILHLDRVNLVSLSAVVFSGDTRLKRLSVHNSTIQEIQRDTFENVAVETAHFEHVNFLSLEDAALAFSLNMTEAGKKNHADIHFKKCRFPDLDVAPISVAFPGKIKFEDNILNCTDLPRTYSWLEEMIGEQKQRDLFCSYLDDNYCESKRDVRKLIRQLFGSGRLSKNLGMSLGDSCPEQFKEYLLSTPKTVTLSNGWAVQANLAVLIITGLVILQSV